MSNTTNNTETTTQSETRFDIEVNSGNSTARSISPEVETWWKVCVHNGHVGTHSWNEVTKKTLYEDFHRNSTTLPHNFWRDMHSLGVHLYDTSVPSLDECRKTTSTETLNTELQSAFVPSHVLTA